ncbi:MAG: acylphosphatase [Nitrospiria bacterium]
MENRKDMSSLGSARLFVSGRVQGVGFRNFTQRKATNLHLAGTVRNLADGRVEIEVDGTREKIEALIQLLRQGPPRSEVADVSVSWRDKPSQAHRFSIVY